MLTLLPPHSLPSFDLVQTARHHGVASLKRFYFDLVGEGSIIRDEIGVEADGPEEAVAEARAVIEAMDEGDELPTSQWYLIIRAEDGVEIDRLPISSS